MALSSRFAEVDVFVVDIADLSDGRHAVCGDISHFAGGKADKNLVAFAAHKLCHIAGGFVGKLMNYSSDNAGKKTYKGLNFQGTIYSTCSVKGATVGLFAGSTSDYFDTAGRTPDPGEQKLTDSLTATDLTLYATGEAFNATARPETYLKTGSDVPKAVGDGVTAYPYDGTLKDTGLDTGTYPYQTDLDEHHGDWAKVSVPVPEMMMAYIEEYVTGGQGVYALKYDGTNPPTIVENSLQPDKVVKDDYYRILSTTELTGATAILDTNSANLQPETNVEIGSVSYYAYTLGTGWDSPANYYHTVTLTPTGGDEQTYLYNPSFACEAFDVTEWTGFVTTNKLPKPNAGGVGASISYGHEDVIIRSARQLANVQAYTNNTETTISTAAQAWTYDQLLNVDFKEYTGTGLTAGKESGSRLGPAKLTTGTYNGNDKTISNLYLGAGTIGSDAYAGLFGTVNGTVNHVLLVDVDVEGDGGVTALAVGGLVGQLNGGSVIDCGIYVSNKDNYDNFTVSGSGGNGVGGLIGQVKSGAVSNSFAAVMVRGTDATNGGTGGTTLTNPAGGFVGQVNTGTFENCYVGGFVGDSKSYDEKSINVTGNNRVGGFVGSISGTVKFTGTNYSTASVGGPDPANLGLFSGGENAPTGDKPYAVAKAFKVDTTGGTTTYDVVAPWDETTYLTNPAEQTDQKSAETYNMGTGATYPYQPAGDLTHHGDWIGLTKGVYYDTVVRNGNTSSPTTGYYANGVNGADIGANPVVGIAADNLLDYATEDGYMFLSETDLGKKVALGINGASFPMSRVDMSTAIGRYRYAYYVEADALKTMPTEGYYFTVNVNGQFFTANFAFAGEIFDYGKVAKADYGEPAEKPGLTSAASDVAIRTPRQLANVGILTNAGTDAGKNAQAFAYDQLLDLDFNAYKKDNMPSIGADGHYNHEPITLEGGSYDGHTYSIIGLTPGFARLEDDGIAASGLFSRAKNATLTDIRIVNSTFTADTGVTGGTGGTTTPTTPTPGGGSTPAGTSHVLESASTTKGTKTYADSYFSVSSESEVNTGGSRTWNKWGTENEYSVSGSENNRIVFKNKVTTSKNYIRFTVSEKFSTVKIWWVAGKADQGVSVVDSSGNKVYTSGLSTSNDQQFTSCEIYESGTYYVGNTTDYSNANYIFKVEVIEYPDASVKVFDPAAKSLATTSPTAWDDGFTVYHTTGTSGSEIDSNKDKSWEDGTQLSTRLNLRGTIDDSHAIAFTTTGAARVEVWWVCGGSNSNRYIGIKKGSVSGTEISATKTNASGNTTNNDPYYSTFSLTEAGTYYAGSIVGNCYIYRIVVIENDPLSGGSTGGTGGTGSGGTNVGVGGDQIRVGALAGILDNATVTNCGVYVKPDSTHTTADAAYNAYEVKNTLPGSDTDLVGGLAGCITGALCPAASPL